MKKETKSKVVALRPKCHKKSIADEPEMIELKRMVREGELDPTRIVSHIQQEDEANLNGKPSPKGKPTKR